MRKTKMLVLCCVFLLGLGIASYANAVSITADAQAHLNANGDTVTDTSTSTNSTQANANNYYDTSESENEGDYLSISTEGDALGKVSGAISGYAAYDASGQQEALSNVDPDGWATSTVNWTETYTASTPGNYSWDFHILDGTLGLDADGPEADLYASYKITIKVDGVNAFYSAAAVHGYQDSGSWTYEYTPEENALTYQVNDQGDDDCLALTIKYDDYDGLIDLGYMSPGDTREISYIMELSASDPGELDGDGDGYFNRHAWANFGDPQNISAGSLTNNGSGNNPVPEPSTILLMGIGLLGLVGYSRKRSKKN